MLDKSKGDKRAFPVQAGMYSQTGMTMRQWYKGQIVSGVVSRGIPELTEDNIDGVYKSIIDFVGILANLMIKEDEEYEKKLNEIKS